jgi:hypothetical protein
MRKNRVFLEEMQDDCGTQAAFPTKNEVVSNTYQGEKTCYLPTSTKIKAKLGENIPLNFPEIIKDY